MQNERPIEAGDVVRLNSGGPDLTVVALIGAQLRAAWLGEDGAHHEMQAPLVCFTPIVDEDA